MHQILLPLAAIGLTYVLLQPVLGSLLAALAVLP